MACRLVAVDPKEGLPGPWCYREREGGRIIDRPYAATLRGVLGVEGSSSELLFNPSLTATEWQTAVDVNEPARFLPQPWPTVDTSTDEGLRIGTLLKMNAIAGLHTKMGEAPLEALEEGVRNGSPFSSTDLRFPFSVELRADGVITRGYECPQVEFEVLVESDFYVGMLTLLAIRSQLRSLGVD